MTDHSEARKRAEESLLYRSDDKVVRDLARDVINGLEREEKLEQLRAIDAAGIRSLEEKERADVLIERTARLTAEAERNALRAERDSWQRKAEAWHYDDSTHVQAWRDERRRAERAEAELEKVKASHRHPSEEKR